MVTEKIYQAFAIVKIHSRETSAKDVQMVTMETHCKLFICV